MNILLHAQLDSNPITPPCSPVEGLRRLFNLSDPQCPCRHMEMYRPLHRARVRRPPECHHEASPEALPGVGTVLGEECAFTKKQIIKAFIHGHNG